MVGVKDDILGEKVVAVVALRDLDFADKNNQETACATVIPKRIMDLHNGNNRNNSSSSSNSGVQGNEDKNREICKAVLEVIKAFLADKLALYKQPREVIVVPSIPRNHLGKVICSQHYELYC